MHTLKHLPSGFFCLSSNCGQLVFFHLLCVFTLNTGRVTKLNKRRLSAVIYYGVLTAFRERIGLIATMPIDNNIIKLYALIANNTRVRGAVSLYNRRISHIPNLPNTAYDEKFRLYFSHYFGRVFKSRVFKCFYLFDYGKNVGVY